MRTARAKKHAASKLALAEASPAKAYDPTPSERAAIAAFVNREDRRKPAPRVTYGKADKGEAPALSIAHPDKGVGGTLMLESLGLPDGDCYGALMTHIANAAAKGQKPETKENLAAINATLALVQAIEPRDTLEAMLAAQMAAVHNATMTFARRLNHVDNIPQQDSASNAFNKLARTFAAQVEALNRHRGKGQQQVTVTHMHVHDGGQAIVAGNVQGGGASSNLEAQPHAKAIAHAPVTPLPSKDAMREAVPFASGEGEEALPNARRC